MGTKDYLISVFWMIFALIYVNLYWTIETNFKYIGLIGYALIGIFWNNKIIGD